MGKKKKLNSSAPKQQIELEKGRGTRTTGPQLQNGSLQNLRYFGHLLWLDGNCWYWKISRHPSTQRKQIEGCLKSEQVHSSKNNYSYMAFLLSCFSLDVLEGSALHQFTTRSEDVNNEK